MLGGVFPARSAHAVNGNGPIVGIASKCLTNANGVTTNGNPVEVQSCNTSVEQAWNWTGDGTLRVQNVCLQARNAGTTPGTAVEIWACNGSNAQKWRPAANGSLTNTNANLCLDTVGGASTDGTDTQLSTCGSAASQDWDISQAVIPLTVVPPASHAPLPPGTPNTPTPTITLDASMAPEFLPWLQQSVKPIVEQWYRVIADHYAYPHHSPMGDFTIRMDPTMEAIASAGGSTRTINLKPSFFKTNLSDVGAAIHEAAHLADYSVAQQRYTLPGWLVEGVAEYYREFVYQDRAPWTPAPNSDLTFWNGYSPTAALLHQAESEDPNFMKDLSIASWNGTYNDNLFVQQTGLTMGKLWHDRTGDRITDPMTITNKSSNACLDLPLSNSDDGVRMQLYGCNGTSAQKWLFKAKTTSTVGIVMGLNGRCLSVLGNGTANGTAVAYKDCNPNANPGRLWRYVQATQNFRNDHSGKCLQPVGGGWANGTQMEIQTCLGASTQNPTPTYQKWLLSSWPVYQ